MNELRDHYLQYVNYNVWANETLATYISTLDGGLLDRILISSFPSIGKTFFHIADAQHIWLSRIRGVSLNDWPSKSLSPDQAIPSVLATSSGFCEFLESKNSSFYNQICSFNTLDGTAHSETNGNIIMHCMNHSTFHRGQLITMLRQAGLEGKIPSTDLITYLRLSV